MLIAIIAFAAQINSRYISGTDSLFKQLISSTGYKPVAALAVGTVAGALVGCVFDGSEPHWIVYSVVTKQQQNVGLDEAENIVSNLPRPDQLVVHREELQQLAEKMQLLP